MLKKSRKSITPSRDTRTLGTELQNQVTRDFDTLSALEIARAINAEDQKVPKAIEFALPEIARAIDAVAEALRNRGRLIYVGTGTSGRLGALDASECPPTFNSKPESVQYVIAGGDRALGHAVEASEDWTERARGDIARKRIRRTDVVCGITASGRTPFTLAAVEYALSKGATTICVTANPGSPITKLVDIAIAVDVGPEVIAGSTRMKAGTMQKLVLNMITTGAFTLLGYVYGNLMVNMHLKNGKLMERGIGIVSQLTGVDEGTAARLLRRAAGSVPVAVLMERAGLTRAKAERRLAEAGGSLRRALQSHNDRNISLS
ncbi:MAG TPA: N-acetylmuramic acid 6-phosphate etherase [candidate division Zixibacteria bacterium]|nr:N-acetylmuramic acid 6-phosphate etherase [candidate division Zixibacteria bacterium]